MSEIRTIKGVDDEAWAKFKSLAAKNQMKMGQMFERMVEKQKEQENKEFWDFILNGERLLSDKEAEEMLEVSRKNRKEYGFRK